MDRRKKLAVIATTIILAMITLSLAIITQHAHWINYALSVLINILFLVALFIDTLKNK